MENTTILRKNEDMVTRVIDDETILLPIYKSSNDIDCIYTLNKVASEVWGLIDGKKTVADIKAEILKKYDATPEEIEEEMQKYLEELREIQALKSI
ncbi:MAG: PqqD family protein [Candidatus Omnitrophica bacterium]|nr:PqqD family protein [Candidatus Omnitrophota bacterium]